MTDDLDTDHAAERAAAGLRTTPPAAGRTARDRRSAALLPILERGERHYDARMRDREGAAKMAAIANLPIGWLFEDPRRDGDDLVLRATSSNGDEIEVAGATAEDAWRAMAEQLAALAQGRLIR